VPKTNLSQSRNQKTADAVGSYRSQAKFAKERFQKAHNLELEYLRNLRQVVRQIDSFIRHMAPDGIVDNVEELNQALTNYARLIRPWAKAVASRMISQVSQSDERAWWNLGKVMGRELRKELQDTPIGQRTQELLTLQVDLITSIPLDAAKRVHELTLKGITEGQRAGDIAKEIMRQNQVSASKAICIARTEVARTASTLTQARAEYIGSTHYIWRTSRDGDVRDSHRKMEGKVVAWDDPPELDNMTGHAGCLPNCRCYPEPILPSED